MKKILTFIAAAVFVVYPSLSFSSYIIHLKDGREFATDRYYEEGDQIKFKRYGGLIGIRKDLVKEIEEIEDVEELPAEKEKAEPAKEDVSQSAKKQGAEKEGGAETEGKTEAGKQEVPEKVAKEQEKPGEVSEEEKKKAEQEKAAEIEMFLGEKRLLMWKIEDATSAFKEAKTRNDRAKKDEYWKKRLLLREALRKLRERVISEHGGKLPRWWDGER